MRSKLVYVLPVHNEEKVLAANVGRLTSYLERWPDAQVFLVENGSKDGSWELSRTLEGGTGVQVRAFQEPNAGIGYAYHRGLAEAVEQFGPAPSRWAVLTAADLPFGFSDLEAAMVDLEGSAARILVGSKAHPQSQIDRSFKRKMMSAAYRLARRAAIGMRVGDSQGSVFLRLDLASALLPKIEARGFFYSTELCHFAERAGETIVELPVVLEEQQRESTVRPARDSLAMARELMRLRAHEKK
ncbi:MAG: glycosyltransferase family 2 protein [Labilithrix sp.]|nr:glycosyltransferase family 2 protein [Labilithrix sp.]